MQEVRINGELFEKFSNFLVDFTPRFSAHLDPAICPSFNYGFGVDGVHFRASFSQPDLNSVYKLTFEESSLKPTPARVSCIISPNGKLLKVAGENVTPARVETIFSTFRQVARRLSHLL